MGRFYVFVIQLPIGTFTITKGYFENVVAKFFSYMYLLLR